MAGGTAADVNLEPDVRLVTGEERESVFRLRYEVYVEELRFYTDTADHEHRRFVDVNDDRARLLLASIDGRPVGTLRMNLGVDGFTQDHIDTFQLGGFLEQMPAEKMLVASRFLVRDEYRGSMVPFRLLTLATQMAVDEGGIELVFCDCQPHLIKLYEALGFRSYCATYNDPGMGLMVPLLLTELEHARAVNSPLLSYYEGTTETDATRRAVAMLPEEPPVRRADELRPELIGEGEDRSSLFRGLDDAELDSVLIHSYAIDFQVGDFLVRADQTARTLFVVLSGQLEARDGARVVRTIAPGEVVGEVAFVLRGRRTLDVVVTSPGTVIGLNDATLRRLIDSDSRAAAVLLRNLCETLAQRLATPERGVQT